MPPLVALAVLALCRSAAAAGPAGHEPDFRISGKASLSVPDKAIEESFRIATDLLVEMRQIAYRHYKYDGWLAVSNGKTNPVAQYDIRDIRYGTKCAAYLWGDDPRLIPEMGKRIFFDQHDKDGKLTWDLNSQCGIEIAHVAKHFSDYLRYSEQDKFIEENWDRQLKIVRWSLAAYDRNGDGLIEQGEHVPTRLWALLIGEPENSFIWDRTQNDVVVVASMEVCEWLELLAAYGKAHHLTDTDWLRSKAAQTHDAIETRAYDPQAGYYYLLCRAAEQKWYHSGCGINEASRELDVTPYYAAFVAGNDAARQKGRGVCPARAAGSRRLSDAAPVPLLLLVESQLSGRWIRARRLLGRVVLQLCPGVGQVRHVRCGVCGGQAPQRRLCARPGLPRMVHAGWNEQAPLSVARALRHLGRGPRRAPSSRGCSALHRRSSASTRSTSGPPSP